MKKIEVQLMGEIVSTNDSQAFNLYKKSSFGEPVGEKIRYTLSEAMFLVEKNKIEIYSKDKKIEKVDLIKKFQKIDKKFIIKYPIYKNLRQKGYILKTALKFGADFRVYEKGKKPGTTHAKWIIFAENESKKISWQDFAAKNRVAHSTKKKLLIALLDEEGDISYYEIKWIKA